MTELTVMVGIPASGKSTYVDRLIELYGSDDVFIYSTDFELGQIAASVGKTYDEVFQDHFREAKRNADIGLAKAIEDGQSVIWDQTNMNKGKRASILSKFPAKYTARCLAFEPPNGAEQWTELNRRLANRPGKTIPDHVVKSMAAQYEAPTIAEGFASVHVFNINGELLYGEVK